MRYLFLQDVIAALSRLLSALQKVPQLCPKFNHCVEEMADRNALTILPGNKHIKKNSGISSKINNTASARSRNVY